MSEFISPSGQLKVSVAPDKEILLTYYGNLANVSTDEYIAFMKKCGELSKESRIGKVFLDMTDARNFSLSLRAAGVNHINDLMLKAMPFFVLAIVKSKNMFDNIATQTALNLARPLSKKSLEGRMFDDGQEAISWLTKFEIPIEFRG